MEGHCDALSALYALHYAYPLSIFLFYTFASIISVCVMQEELAKPARRKVLYSIIFYVMLGILGAHVSHPFSLSILGANTKF
jgi:hypothetical protein